MRKPRGDEQRFAHWKANKLCLTCNAKTKSCDCDLENAHVLLAEHSRRSGRTHYGSESGRSRYNIERKGEGVIALERLTLRGGAGDPARDCKVQSGVPCKKSGQARFKCNTCTTHSSCFYIKTKIRSESLASNSPGCRCQATTFSKSPATQQACCPISFHRPQGDLVHDLDCSIQDCIYQQTSLDDATCIAMLDDIASLDVASEYHHHGRGPDSVADLDGTPKQRVTERTWTVG